MTPEEYLSTGSTLKWLLAIAWLLPLAGFAVEVFGGYWGSRKSKAAALKLIRRLLRKQSYSYRHSAQAVEMHTLTSRILINCHTMNGVSNEPLSSGL